MSITLKEVFYLFKGRIILSLPSIEVLAEAAAAVNRRGAVLHVLETTVLAWIKQIKVRIQSYLVKLIIW